MGDGHLTLTLKPNRAVRQVKVTLRPLRIFFQTYPGTTGPEDKRAIASIPYTLRIPGHDEIQGQTASDGQIPLPGLQSDLVGELEILDTVIRLVPRGFNKKEKLDGQSKLTIQGAKRRLMILGYYDSLYRTESSGPNAQTPNGWLNTPEIENAILHFQVDHDLEPNGEIERHEMKEDETNPGQWQIDTDQKYGFHQNLWTSTIGQFHPDFVAALVTSVGTAPPNTIESESEFESESESESTPVSDADGQSLIREFYDGQRFVPVRFSRLPPRNPGDVDPQRPELDERGYADGRFGPVVSLMTGSVIQVGLDRVHVSPATALLLQSTDASVATATLNGDVVEITGVAGAGPTAQAAAATINVCLDDESQTVLHRLYVQVYDPIVVAVAVHFVSIGKLGESDDDVPPESPILNRESFFPILERVNNIWRAAGIQFNVNEDAWLDERTDLAEAGVMQMGSQAELLTVTDLNPADSHLNIYVVPNLGGPAGGWTVPPLGVVISDHDKNGAHRDEYQMAKTVAHEIGHFLGLNHPGTKYPRGDPALTPGGEHHIMEDYWSRRMLMYGRTGLTIEPDLPKKVRQRGRQLDVGNGEGRNGVMLGSRNVPAILSTNNESEVESARSLAKFWTGSPE